MRTRYLVIANDAYGGDLPWVTHSLLADARQILRSGEAVVARICKGSTEGFSLGVDPVWPRYARGYPK